MTNARSLSPKIESLQNAFTEHELDFALVTESWLSDGALLDKDVMDLEYGTNLKIIYKNRPKKLASARAVRGGVSIVFNKSRCSFKERKISGNGFELVAAVGKVGKLARQVALFCIYLQPRIKAAELQQINDLINTEIILLKSRSSPLIFLGGDLNRKLLDGAVEDFLDFKQVNFEPTRGDACLDVLLSNSTGITSAVWPPLETLQGVPSDHRCVVFSAKEERKRDFVWVRKQARKHTARAVDNFGFDLARTNWSMLCPPNASPDDLVGAFQGHIAQLTDQHFPLQNIRMRSNEAQWITNAIRKLSKQKKRVFKREGKSRLWIRLRDDIIERSRRSKVDFVDRAESTGSTKTYYSAIRQVSTCEKPPEWNLMDMFPGSSPQEVGDLTAQYFTRISNGFEPLRPSLTTGPSRRPLSPGEVLEYLKKAKKPNSAVEGDLRPCLMRTHYAKIVLPVTNVFNAIFRDAQWPASWKEETTVIIPKTNNPNDLSECRNISCTHFLSKVLESVLLDDLRREIEPDPVQYGGMKGCSVDHMLIDLYEAILRPLEGGDPSIILGIDYEKAFNRLDHHECLRQLRRLGASDSSLGLVRAFLTGRSMRVKVGGEVMNAWKLSEGSPQGSILGCFLYCATTQQIGPGLQDRTLAPLAGSQHPTSPTPNATTQPTGSPVTPDDGFGLLDLLAPGLDHSDTSGSSFHTAPGSPPDSPVTPPCTLGDQIYAFLSFFKYVDDTTLVETVDKNLGIRHLSANTPLEEIPAALIGPFLCKVIELARAIGMKVNCLKTQMVVISGDTGYNVTASFIADGVRIASASGMKLMGFMICGTGMNAQVAFIKDKFRRKFWSLIHLRRSGIGGDQLFRLYTVLVRPVIETNAVVYHSMLTTSQASELEKLQKKVLRLCYGNFTSYATILEEKSVDKLETRRVKAIEKFARKVMKNKRFADKWLIPREDVQINLRNRRPYIENHARTSRYQSSPLITIQKTINDILTRNK